MWDGYGFTGKGFDGAHYQTMNLATYLLLGAKTGWPLLMSRQALVRNKLDNLQLPNGGVSTWYTMGAERDTEGNTENTSLATYAFIRPAEY